MFRCETAPGARAETSFRHGLFGLVLFCIAGSAPVAAAQTGEIAGVVVDATGGVLPGATVTLSGVPGAPRQAQTDAEGRFAFTSLLPGVYSVRTVIDIKLPTASRRSPISTASGAWHTAR